MEIGAANIVSHFHSLLSARVHLNELNFVKMSKKIFTLNCKLQIACYFSSTLQLNTVQTPISMYSVRYLYGALPMMKNACFFIFLYDSLKMYSRKSLSTVHNVTVAIN